MSYGVGVERTFPLHAPTIGKIEVVSRGDVRRAKLYYLRDRVGKAGVRHRAGALPPVVGRVVCAGEPAQVAVERRDLIVLPDWLQAGAQKRIGQLQGACIEVGDIAGNAEARAGVLGLEAVDEITMLCVPDLMSPRVLSGLGVAIVSTSRGLMTDHEARKNKMGGEILCEVW